MGEKTSVDSQVTVSGNLTRAAVTGKVPMVVPRTRNPGRKNKKRIQMSAGKKSHAKQMKREGKISASAAARFGV